VLVDEGDFEAETGAEVGEDVEGCFGGVRIVEPLIVDFGVLTLVACLVGFEAAIDFIVVAFFCAEILVFVV
jgi:hypothetical protein